MLLENDWDKLGRRCRVLGSRPRQAKTCRDSRHCDHRFYYLLKALRRARESLEILMARRYLYDIAEEVVQLIEALDNSFKLPGSTGYLFEEYTSVVDGSKDL
jgi:hypothetical protein